MSTWTTTALQTLEGYLENNRSRYVTSGADAEEVISDLRRHVQEEVAALKLPVVTEDDVQRIVRRIGPAPVEEPGQFRPEMPPASLNGATLGKSFRSFLLFFFGVLLPAVTLGFELTTHLCAGVFFDPLPTWFHVLFVALVPAANLFAWEALRGRGTPALNGGNGAPHSPLQTGMARFLRPGWQRERWLWLTNGAAVGVSAFYSVLYAPMAPFAAIGVIYFGFGLLPLSPLFAFGGTLRFRRHLRQRFPEHPQPAARDWWLAAGVPLLALTLFALPAPLTRHWMEQAESTSPDQSLGAIKQLRRWGGRDVMLQACYGQGNRLWIEVFGGRQINTEKAREVYYRVTGQPFNAVPPPVSKYQRAGRELFDEFSWDADLGGETVAGQVTALSLTQSRFDGLCQPDEAWAYCEWTLEFRNDHHRRQREARAQIQLPPGGVVSRLTLWINGEEREAAFGGRAQVRAAYQEVAVRQRRDPVLVTTTGPDRVLVQCFPIPPNGGTMKIRLGITAPLTVEATNAAALKLPCFVERNFAVPETLQHSFWLQSSQPPHSALKQLTTAPAEAGKYSVRGQLADSLLNLPEATLRFPCSERLRSVLARDTKKADAPAIRQTLEAAPAKLPGRIAIVLDGSRDMDREYPRIAAALDGLPAQPETTVWLAQDGARPVYRSTWGGRETVSSVVGKLRGTGGQDDVPALLQAWEWAAATNGGVVLWLHGSQPILLANLEALKQRLEWRSANDPILLDAPMRPGPNRVIEQLSSLGGITALPRLGSLEEDLERLFAIWSGRRPQWNLVRASEPELLSTAGLPSSTGSSHIVRLWALEQVRSLIRSRQSAEAVKLATKHQLVTPVTGAVVLETQRQYDVAGLTPVDAATVPVVPEPGAWLLLLLGLAAMILCRWRRRTGSWFRLAKQ